jgi:hypothetical protein
MNEFVDVGFEVLTAVVTKSAVFWNIAQCSPLKVILRFGVTFQQHLQALLATCFHALFLPVLFFDPKDEGCSSVTSVEFQRATRRYIPDDSTPRIC